MLDKFLIDPKIPRSRFACDLSKCKGACCTMPGQRGAPLLDEEVEEIEKAYPVIKKYLSFRHKDTIEERGLIQGRKGDYTTQVVDRQACVFAYFDGDIAKCAFERAFIEGELTWRKPISCHLFPIRVGQGSPVSLRYEEITECKPAISKGEAENMPLPEFLKVSLSRAFGEAWYDEFVAYCRTQLEGLKQEVEKPRSEA